MLVLAFIDRVSSLSNCRFYQQNIELIVDTLNNNWTYFIRKIINKSFKCLSNNKQLMCQRNESNVFIKLTYHHSLEFELSKLLSLFNIKTSLSAFSSTEGLFATWKNKTPLELYRNVMWVACYLCTQQHMLQKASPWKKKKKEKLLKKRFA